MNIREFFYERNNPIASGARTGMVILAILLVFVLTTGSTFGQRCSEIGFTGVYHDACVVNLKRGNAHDNIDLKLKMENENKENCK